MVADLYPGTNADGGNSSNPEYLLNVNGTLFFIANRYFYMGEYDYDTDYELWKSDGTANGTFQLTSFGIQNAYFTYVPPPMSPFNLNGTVLFPSLVDSTLWKSDGTSNGTTQVSSFVGVAGPLVNMNGIAYFAGYDSTHGYELFKTDGTTAGTLLVRDIYPGMTTGSDPVPYSSYPQYLTTVSNTLFFTATDGTHGDELWKSDGTAAGTVLVADINPGTPDSLPKYLVNVAGTLYFSADDGIDGIELWKSDGTAAGTVLAADVWPGENPITFDPNSSYPEDLLAVNGTLFFVASDYVSELWEDAVVSLPPLLTIARSGPGAVQVSWPYPSTGWSLQQNNNLSTVNWATPPETVNNDGTNNFIVVSPPSGNLFFRLKSN